MYLYRTNEKQEKPKATGTDNETNKVERQTAMLKSDENYLLGIQNDMYKFWFNIADNNHEYDSRVNTFKSQRHG